MHVCMYVCMYATKETHQCHVSSGIFLLAHTLKKHCVKFLCDTSKHIIKINSVIDSLVTFCSVMAESSN